MTSTIATRFASKQTSFHEIPIIDIADLVDGSDVDGVAAAIGKACEQVGFFYIKNHGVPAELVERMYRVTADFFAMPEKTKDAVHVSKSGVTVRGYIPPFAENADPQNNTDLKEAFDYGAEQDEVSPFFGPNLMPAEFPEFKQTCDEYHATMMALARKLVGAFAISLGLEPDYFERLQRNPITIQRLLHYPPQTEDADDRMIGIGAHTDKGILTILSQDEVGGLQVRNKEGEWISAPPVPGTYIINIGDLIQMMTNGRYTSTVHRVVNQSGAERYSIPFFIDLDYDAPIQTVPTCVTPEQAVETQGSDFAPMTCGEYKEQWFLNVYPHLQDDAATVAS